MTEKGRGEEKVNIAKDIMIDTFKTGPSQQRHDTSILHASRIIGNWQAGSLHNFLIALVHDCWTDGCIDELIYCQLPRQSPSCTRTIQEAIPL